MKEKHILDWFTRIPRSCSVTTILLSSEKLSSFLLLSRKLVVYTTEFWQKHFVADLGNPGDLFNMQSSFLYKFD